MRVKKRNFFAINRVITKDRLTTVLLMTVLLLVVVGSFFPLRLSYSWAEIKAALQAGVTLSAIELKIDFRTVVERLLAFVPLGFLIYQKLVQRQWQNATVTAAALVLLVALVIELSQAVISIRHPLLSDLILAVVAGIVGIYFSISTRRILLQSLSNTLRRLSSGVLVLGNYIIVCILIAAIAPASTGIEAWDCSYPLLVGNELTYKRPWQGKIRGFAIYPRALTQGEIRRLSQVSWASENAAIRKTMGAFSLYSFAATKGNRALPLGNNSSPMPLIIKAGELKAGQIKKGALQIRNPMLVKSAGPADDLCQAILASQAFTLETEIASTDLTQTGPARIISNSINTRYRNFTLGEQEGDLIWRVRTPQNGINGSRNSLQTHGDVLAGGWHHVAASYTHGVAKLFVDGKEAVPALHYDKFLLLGTTLTTQMALVTGLLFFIMGLITSVIFYSQGLAKALLLTLISVSLVPLIASLSIALGLGRHLNPAFFAAVLLVPLLGFALGWGGQQRFINAHEF